MVWHIFRKDWKLLWPFFFGVAFVQFIPALIRIKLGLFEEDPVLKYASGPAVAIATLAIAFLTVAIVNQDSIPGVRQDWLVRPVKRRDLLLAKLFFVFVLVEASAIAAGIFQVLASGFSLGEAVRAAIVQNLFLIIIIALPALALASVTRTTMECVIGAILMYVGGVQLLIAFAIAHGGKEGSASLGTGAAWITQDAGLVVIVLGTCVVLAMQYYRRKTSAARGLIAISAVLFVSVLQFLPWRAAFAFQQYLSPQPGIAHSISLSFDPSLGKFRRPSGITMSDEDMWKHLNKQGSPTEVFLPLRIVGIPTDSVLKADRSEFRLITADGKVVYRGTGEDLEVRAEGSSMPQANAHLELDIPNTVYARLQSQPVRLEINYFLTLFRLGSGFGIPALGGDQRASQMGWCATKMNEPGTAVELRCMQAGNGTTCATAFLENPATGLRNPSISGCYPDYAPRFLRADTDPMSHYSLNLPFRDNYGLTQYPVDGRQLPKSQVVLRLYEPKDHFTRELVIPDIVLQSWRAE